MQLRLEGINKLKDYFIAEIREREIISKTLSQYIAAFHYVDKTLLVLSAISGGVSIASFATVAGATVASLGLVFLLEMEFQKHSKKEKKDKETK